MVRVFASLSILISILASPNSVLASPIEIRCFNLVVASVPLEINSRKRFRGQNTRIFNQWKYIFNRYINVSFTHKYIF